MVTGIGRLKSRLLFREERRMRAKDKRQLEQKVLSVRFKYPLSNRYYLLTNSSGYPSAEYRFPYQELSETGFVVREVDR